jgi:hypothetical protein
MNIKTACLLYHLSNLETQYLDCLDIRNNSPIGSKRYKSACKLAEAIEQEASEMVFGDTTHSFSECNEQADELRKTLAA